MPDDSRCEKCADEAYQEACRRLRVPGPDDIKEPRSEPFEGATEFLVLRCHDSYFKRWGEVHRVWWNVPLPLARDRVKRIILHALGGEPGIDLTITPETFREYMVIPMTDAAHCSITMEFRPLEVVQTETFEGADDTHGEIVRVNQVVRTAGPPELIDREVLG